MGIVKTAGLKYSTEVLEDTVGLRFKPAINQFPRSGIDGNLARKIKRVPHSDGLRIRTDGGWRVDRGDRLPITSTGTGREGKRCNKNDNMTYYDFLTPFFSMSVIASVKRSISSIVV